MAEQANSTAAAVSPTSSAKVSPTAASNSAAAAPNNMNVSKLSIQLKKLTDANAKYKHLLKLAKERIQKQEEETVAWKTEKSRLEESVEELKKRSTNTASSNHRHPQQQQLQPPDTVTNILRIARRIRHTPLPQNNNNNTTVSSAEQIWALMEVEDVSDEAPHTNRRYQEWLCFSTEADLLDHVRRDTGEPLVPPPYSLSPEQAAAVQQQAEQTVANMTEEFRRFRVKAELAKEQAAVQLRECKAAASTTQHLSAVTTTTPTAADAARQQVQRLQAEMATQEAQWKEAYDRLVAENEALQSKGSEAMLAAQWRQRYETCTTEKQVLEERLQQVDGDGGMGNNGTATTVSDAEKYEQKYRDLKGTCRIGAMDRQTSRRRWRQRSVLCFVLSLWLTCIPSRNTQQQSPFDYTAKRPRRFLKRNRWAKVEAYLRQPP